MMSRKIMLIIHEGMGWNKRGQIIQQSHRNNPIKAERNREGESGLRWLSTQHIGKLHPNVLPRVPSWVTISASWVKVWNCTVLEEPWTIRFAWDHCWKLNPLLELRTLWSQLMLQCQYNIHWMMEVACDLCKMEECQGSNYCIQQQEQNKKSQWYKN